MKTRILQLCSVVVILGVILTACAAPTPQVVQQTVVVPQTVVAQQTVVAKETVVVPVTVAAPTAAPMGKSLLPVNVPRKDLFVVDQIFRYGVAGNYNMQPYRAHAAPPCADDGNLLVP